MASRNSSPHAKRGASLSVMLGTLLVPLSAYAASTLVDSSGLAESVTSTESSPPVTEVTVTADSTAADLETACGEAGLAMVAAETAGSISELQQAALDALRGICAEQGISLPGPAAIQPLDTSVDQPTSPPPAPTSEQVVVASDDDHSRHGGDQDDDDDHGRHGGDDDDDDHGRHGGDDDGEDHGRHGGDDE